MAKKLHPVLSARSLRAQDPTLQGYIDLFISRMRVYGGGEKGVELKTVRISLLTFESVRLTVKNRQWLDWLAMDISADMAYNRKLH